MRSTFEARFADREDVYALVVDDLSESRALVAGELSKYGMRVIECTDPRRVVDILHRRPEVRVVLVQWHIDPAGGAELVKQLRGNPVTCFRRIIMVTDHPDDVTSGLEAGIDDFLTLPLSPATLREKLDLLGVMAA